MIFHCFFGVKRERKENGVDTIFRPGPLFFSSPNWGEKGIEKKSTKLPLFHCSTFNNKGIIVIYSLPFYFSFFFFLDFLLENIRLPRLTCLS